MDTFSVVFYETLSGDKPAKVFLNELSDKQRAKTIRDLKILERMVFMSCERSKVQISQEYCISSLWEGELY